MKYSPSTWGTAVCLHNDIMEEKASTSSPPNTLDKASQPPPPVSSRTPPAPPNLWADWLIPQSISHHIVRELNHWKHLTSCLILRTLSSQEQTCRMDGRRGEERNSGSVGKDWNKEVGWIRSCCFSCLPNTQTGTGCSALTVSRPSESVVVSTVAGSAAGQGERQAAILLPATIKHLTVAKRVDCVCASMQLCRYCWSTLCVHLRHAAGSDQADRYRPVIIIVHVPQSFSCSSLSNRHL